MYGISLCIEVSETVCAGSVMLCNISFFILYTETDFFLLWTPTVLASTANIVSKSSNRESVTDTGTSTTLIPTSLIGNLGSCFSCNHLSHCK